MPGYLIQQGATVLCAHGGNATAAAANSRVTVNGTPTLVLAEPWQVAGCAATPSCVTSKWVTGATRVTSGGQPVVIGSGEALSAPSGAPLVPYVVQSRVTAELGAGTGGPCLPLRLRRDRTHGPGG